ncbi:phage tail tape measure protein [Streptomyces diastaticus]|uniref:phage tail tape measure protein n=1 Tax=Streptomyces diastaticus TaxID=1956 RepID=UPI003804F162
MGDADQLSRTLDQASEDVSAFGEQAKGLALAAGGAIAVGIGAGIAEALEREVSNDLLAAQLGASPAEAKKLGEAAGAVYSAGYGESVADANEALKSLWQQGLVPADATADELADISKRAMDVATVLGDDVGPTSNAVGQMLKTGLAKNAEEAFDILTRGAQQGVNKSEDLLDTFNEYGTQFRNVGLSGKDAMGLLSQGLQAGARDADVVADTLKEFSIEAVAGSDKIGDAWEALGLDSDKLFAQMGKGGDSARDALDQTLKALNKMEPGTKRNAMAVELFGTKAEDMGDALYALDLDTAAAELGKVDGAAKAAGETMHDNAATKIKAFTRGLQTGIVDFIGGKVIPMLEKMKPAFEVVGAAVSSAVGFVRDNKAEFQVLAGLITALLIPALIQWGVQSTVNAGKAVVAWVTSSATAVIEATKQAAAHARVVAGWIAAGVQAGIQAARVVAGWVLMGAQATAQGLRMAAAWLLAMGPIPLIIAAIVGLVAVVVANWDAIWGYTKKIFQWLWDWVGKIFGWLGDLFSSFPGASLISKHWDTIVTKTKSAFTTVKNFARDALNGVVDFVRSLPGRIVAAGAALLGAGKSIGGKVIDGIKNGLSKLGGFASSLASAVSRAAKGAINGVIDLLNWAIPNKLGWGKLSIDLPDNPIPKIRAMGGPASGMVRVGERGPETVMLPNGSTVLPNHARTGGGGVTVNVQTNADPFAIGREVAWALRTSPV